MKPFRLVLSLVLILSFAFAALSPETAHTDDLLEEYPVRFAVIGDRTGEAQEGIYPQVLAEIERLRPDFAVTVGDMIEGYTSDSVTIANEWREYYEEINTALTMPVHLTPGNHDITFDGMLPSYEQHAGKPYHSFDHRSLHFVVLDNSRWEAGEGFPEEQLEWIADDLKKHADASHTFVLFHKPFWYLTLGTGKQDPLHDILVEHGVDAVFSGHFHQYFSGTFDNIMYTNLGSSGGGADPGPSGLLYHFVYVTVDGQGIHIAPVKMGGVLPWDEVPAEDYRLFSSMRKKSISFDEPLEVADDMTVDGSTVAVRFINLSPESAYDDTLTWDLPEGWSVEPPKAHLTVPPSQSKTTEFTFRCEGNLYPLPDINTKFEYAPGRMAPIEQTLEIGRPLNCAKLSDTPVIDGVLSEPVWQNAATAFLGPDGDAPTTDSVAISFAYDENNLYWAVYCYESEVDSMRAELTERDDGVYAEDCFGVMLARDIKTGVGYQFYINPLGTLYDQKFTLASDGHWGSDNTFNAECEIATKQGEDYWTIEVRLPLDQLELKANSGERWRVNFRRKQARLSSWAGWQLPWQYDVNGYGVLNME